MYHDSDYKETKLPFATIALLCILASVVLVISSIFLGAIPFIGGVACFIAGAVFSVLNLKRYDDDVNIIIIVSLVAALIVISGCALMSTHKGDDEIAFPDQHLGFILVSPVQKPEIRKQESCLCETGSHFFRNPIGESRIIGR